MIVPEKPLWGGNNKVCKECKGVSFVACIANRNGTFPSYCEPLYESKAKCKTFLMKISFVCI